MNTNGYGRQAGVSARAGLWIVLALLCIALVLLSVGYEQAAARAATQGTWCLRTGPATHGLALWSEDGGATWQRP